MAAKPNFSEYMICVKNEGYIASLELRKIYQAIPDDDAAAAGFVRIVDESNEDYLFPQDFFVPIKLPKAAIEAFAVAS